MLQTFEDVIKIVLVLFLLKSSKADFLPKKIVEVTLFAVLDKGCMKFSAKFCSLELCVEIFIIREAVDK